MDSLTDSEYFFYGSSIQDSNGHHIQYGLFNAVDDRFVLTSTNLEVLRWISFLFSSRFNLFVYRLDTASNFRPNLIDNEVCTKWTVGDNQILQFTKFNDWRTVIDVKTLVERPTAISSGLLADDIPYLMAAHQWIEDCLARCRQLGIDHILASKFIDVPMTDPAIDQCKHIFMTIYTEPNLQTARSKIGL